MSNSFGVAMLHLIGATGNRQARSTRRYDGFGRAFNVPLLGGGQMYQALRSLGVDSELVIYPNQSRGITIPNYKKDRLERWRRTTSI
jgi:hypothetical protein